MSIYKIKIWNTGYADAKFSKWIRERDIKCRRCERNGPLDCSHYWKRGDSGTRFDPNNCVALCRECHTIWERQQNLEYKQFMVDWLGQEEYDLLEKRARSFKKRIDAVLEVMELLKKDLLH